MLLPHWWKLRLASFLAVPPCHDEWPSSHGDFGGKWVAGTPTTPLPASPFPPWRSPFSLASYVISVILGRFGVARWLSEMGPNTSLLCTVICETNVKSSHRTVQYVHVGQTPCQNEIKNASNKITSLPQQNIHEKLSYLHCINFAKYYCNSAIAALFFLREAEMSGHLFFYSIRVHRANRSVEQVYFMFR